MSAEPRYYYVDTQNQAAGPIAMAGLLALKAAGTVTDATLVVLEGGAEWAAFSTLKTANPPTTSPQAGTPMPQSVSATTPAGVQAVGGPSSTAEPLWASKLSQKIDQLTATMDKLVVAMEKARPAAAVAPVMAPATAALHAEKINLNPMPKPGIAAFNPTSTAPAATPGAIPRPTPLPAGVPVASPRGPGTPTPVTRPGVATPLSPLAVPANAQKSALPLPALGKTPGPAPAGTPKPAAPAPVAAPAKGNIFSKFLKK